MRYIEKRTTPDAIRVRSCLSVVLHSLLSEIGRKKIVIQVLVIDDSSFTLRTQTELIQGIGLTPLAAKGGEEGIRIFERHLPQIVLCDIMMPDVSGYEVMEIIKEIKQDVFLYFVSGEMTPEIESKVKSLGGRGVIEKPLSPETLRAIVQEYQNSTR